MKLGLMRQLLVHVLGRRATAEGRRGFQPTVGNRPNQSRRGATIEPVTRAEPIAWNANIAIGDSIVAPRRTLCVAFEAVG